MVLADDWIKAALGEMELTDEMQEKAQLEEPASRRAKACQNRKRELEEAHAPHAYEE